MQNNPLIERLTALAKPIVEKNNCELYHFRVCKRSREYIFRVYIDNEKEFLFLTVKK